MAAKRGDLSLLKEALTPEKSEESNIWNVFVQILLPLVLILTFVAALDIMRYKLVADVEKVRADEAYGKISDMLDKDPTASQRNFAFIKIQLLELLRALDKIKEEKMGHIKFIRFVDRTSEGRIVNADRIELDRAMIKDDDFKTFCGKTYYMFSNIQSRYEEMRNLYQSVLSKAKIMDGSSFSYSNNETPVYDHAVEGNKAEKSEITPENRSKLLNAINDFLNTLEKDTIRLQTDLIDRIFDYLIQNPEDLKDENLKRLADLIISAPNEKVRMIHANEFYRQFIQIWQRKVEGGSGSGSRYMLLRKTWEGLQILE